MKSIWKVTIIWGIMSFILMGFILFSDFHFAFLYYCFMIIAVGIPMWELRHEIRQRIIEWKAKHLTKFLILGYGMVLFEEIFAALFNHLTEGFSFGLFLLRVFQFSFLNLFAFTGLILGLYYVLNKWHFSDTEAFFTVGAFGLFAEKTYTIFLSNFPGFLFWVPLVVYVYGIILTPAIWSHSKRGRANMPFWVKYPVALFIFWLASLIPILVLMLLRTQWPGLFPPAEFIHLG